MPLIARFIPLLLVATLSGVAAPVAAQGIGATETRQRIFSTLGFSFVAPKGPSWSEQFGKNQITYLKKTDPAVVSFYSGALEGRLQSKLMDKDALVAFVRSKKDQWGSIAAIPTFQRHFR